jgi:hypothetical protein
LRTVQHWIGGVATAGTSSRTAPVWNPATGESHVHGPEGVRFYTRAKVVTSRWPHVKHPVAASYHFPTAQ